MKAILGGCCTFLIILVASCSLVVDVDVPIREPQITVNSLFRPDSTWSVSLTRSRNILDDTPFFIPANVSEVAILDESQNVISILQQKGKLGVYGSLEKPESGKIYSIRVSAPDRNSITATGSVPNPVYLAALKIDTLNVDEEFGQTQNIYVQITIDDPENEINYYRFQLYYRHVIEYFRYDLQQTVRDTTTALLNLYEESHDLLNGSKSTYIISDSRFSGKQTVIKFKPFYPRGTDILEAGMVTQSLSEEYYKYITTLDLQRNTDGDPFAQPVKVYSNVNNGFGIFAGYATTYWAIKE